MNSQKLIAELKSFFEKSKVDQIRQCQVEVHEIESSFAELPRSEMSVSELISLKYKMQHWRKKALSLVMGFLKTTKSSGDKNSAIALLIGLNLLPSEQDCATIIELGRADADLKDKVNQFCCHYSLHQALRELNPRILEDQLLLAGPAARLPIIANTPSKCTYDKWSEMIEFSDYFYKGEGIVYRGINFLPGDVILCNVNRDGNGIYTFLSEPKGYAYHVGVFAVISKGERKIPAVIEAYKLGVRAVPLSTFLSAQFNSYIEVFRQREVPVGFYEKLNRHAAQIEKATKGYNFDTEDADRSYLACTTVANHLFQLAGARQISTKSHYTTHPQVLRSMRTVGIELHEFFSPSDFVVDAAMKYIGSIDNNHLYKNLSRELTERFFFKLLTYSEIQISQLPFVVTVGKFSVNQIRAGTVLGKLIGFFAGFTQENLPKGPTTLLSVIEVYEKMMKYCARTVCPKLEMLMDDRKPVDVDQLMDETDVDKLLFDASEKTRKTLKVVHRFTDFS